MIEHSDQQLLTSLAVEKEHVLTISTDMWVPVEDSSPSRRFDSQLKIRVPVQVPNPSRRFMSKSLSNSQRTAYSPTPMHLEMHSCKETQTAINSAETKRTKFSRNDRNLKSKVTSDEYYNMIFHVNSHNLEYYCNSPITCNCANGTPSYTHT